MVTKTERLILENQKAMMITLSKLNGNRPFYTGYFAENIKKTEEHLNPTKEDKAYEKSFA